jgi:Nucleotidyl transferase AbiEii toxin, Type IV TA system
MDLLDAINDHSFLKEKLVLKGGTALNLFLFQFLDMEVILCQQKNRHCEYFL